MLRILILTICITSALWSHGQNTIENRVVSFDECNLQNNTFGDQEVLVYRLYYNWKFVWLPAGEVKFIVNTTDDTYEFEAIGTTFASYGSFYEVEDYFYSQCDRGSMRPISFVRDIHEDKYRLFDSISFHQDTYEVDMIHGKSRETAEQSTRDLERCIQDMLSMIYKVRNIDLDQIQKGSSFKVDVIFDKEIYNIKLKMAELGKKKKIRNLGKFKTNKIEVSTVKGNVFDDGSVISIWFSDDNNKLPLQIESPVAIGSVKAVLQSYENVRHDFASKMD